MKVSVDIDCTPEEARRFLGLPDLTPIHDLYLEQMRKAMTDGIGQEAFGEMMKSWAPLGENGMALWRQMMDGMSGKR
ncbi:hypothetical protein IC614_09360 [Allosphingosinicella flava]|uniref:Uncharacterized protein n=1 Tax=Allosphingosinicella flava TaxID=2771430 RepID=A0A7T2LLI9_9SPHN|nr:DUF6489 family protein [Sphingosinicella flava]QPQ54536.1 hypothetical protein IC614_09360 [Sphingosinicella flava]